MSRYHGTPGFGKKHSENTRHRWGGAAKKRKKRSAKRPGEENFRKAVNSIRSMAKKATPETRQSVVGVIASFMQVKNFSPEDINALRKHLGSLQDIEEFRAQASRLFGKIVKISGGKSP